MWLFTWITPLSPLVQRRSNLFIPLRVSMVGPSAWVWNYAYIFHLLPAFWFFALKTFLRRRPVTRLAQNGPVWSLGEIQFLVKFPTHKSKKHKMNKCNPGNMTFSWQFLEAYYRTKLHTETYAVQCLIARGPKSSRHRHLQINDNTHSPNRRFWLPRCELLISFCNNWWVLHTYVCLGKDCVESCRNTSNYGI